MKKFCGIILILSLLLSGCSASDPRASTKTVDTLPIIPLNFLGYDDQWIPPEIYDYISMDEDLDISGSSGLFSYPNATPGETFIYLADLNCDGTYEVYMNLTAGSGLVRDFVKCYEPVSKQYFLLGGEFMYDYLCICYEENLYIIEHYSTVSKPCLSDVGLVLEVVCDSLQDEILNCWKISINTL